MPESSTCQQWQSIRSTRKSVELNIALREHSLGNYAVNTKSIWLVLVNYTCTSISLMGNSYVN